MPLEVRSTVDALADRLRQEIFDGKLVPGQAIPQEEISARFGVSRSPLREALRQLEAEGTIEYRANRGAFVATTDDAAVRQTYQIRHILEDGAVELALPNLDAAALAELRARAGAMNAETDARAYVRAHHDFHQLVYAATGNPLLAKAIHDHSIRVARIPGIKNWITRIRACSQDDHAALLDALERRDAEAARAVTREHLDHMEAIMLDVMASQRA